MNMYKFNQNPNENIFHFTNEVLPKKNQNKEVKINKTPQYVIQESIPNDHFPQSDFTEFDRYLSHILDNSCQIIRSAKILEPYTPKTFNEVREILEKIVCSSN